MADEPTGNLDEENRNIVLDNLIELNKQGKTVIIVTHDPYVAEKCSKIISLWFRYSKNNIRIKHIKIQHIVSNIQFILF